MAKRYFEDFTVGEGFEAGGYRMTGEEIVEFARRYDPVSFHTDEAAGRHSVFGGLVASGIHTIAVWNRLRKDAEDGLVMLVGLGLDELRYPHPVRPGDVLSMRSEVIEISPSARKPDRAVMRFRQTVRNQDGVEVMTAVLALLVAGRRAVSPLESVRPLRVRRQPPGIRGGDHAMRLVQLFENRGTVGKASRPRSPAVYFG